MYITMITGIEPAATTAVRDEWLEGTSYMVHDFVLYCKCIFCMFSILFAHIKRSPDPNPKPNLNKGTTWHQNIRR
jgi:hypothetical protein